MKYEKSVSLFIGAILVKPVISLGLIVITLGNTARDLFLPTMEDRKERLTKNQNLI